MPEVFTDGDQRISTGMNKFYEHVRLFYNKVTDKIMTGELVCGGLLEMKIMLSVRSY